MRDYSHLYRRELLPGEEWGDSWDVFLSAYNSSDRVQLAFEKVRAARKLWIVHEEYGYDDSELPSDAPFLSGAMDETSMAVFWDQRVAQGSIVGAKICVDATGFMRPHLLFLLRLLVARGVVKFDVLYSEPEYYRHKDETAFSGVYVEQVRQVYGFEGVSGEGGDRDTLIIGAGYETHLVEEVAEDKDRARKVLILGLPSLRADMYQQNAWRAWLAEDVLERGDAEKHFAPAADPFATATVLSELIGRERTRSDVSHLYLAPLATNAQAVGFALFYLSECVGSNTSIIFPFTRDYERETAVGFSRTWLHTLEFR